MNIYGATLYFALIIVGINYTQTAPIPQQYIPQPLQQQQYPIKQSILLGNYQPQQQTAQSHSGNFWVSQSSPLTQFGLEAHPQGQQTFATLQTAQLSAPEPLPQYIAIPVVIQQQQFVTQPQLHNFMAPQSAVQPSPPIPQIHQQQFVNQHIFQNFPHLHTPPQNNYAQLTHHRPQTSIMFYKYAFQLR